MRIHLSIVAAATAALLAGGALAQSRSSNFPQSTAVNPTPLPADTTTPGNPTVGETALTSPDTTVNPAPDATVAPAAGAPTERAPAASVGGADIVSNGPVPDTPTNRAKYGRPLSNAGRMTKPAGN